MTEQNNTKVKKRPVQQHEYVCMLHFGIFPYHKKRTQSDSQNWISRKLLLEYWRTPYKFGNIQIQNVLPSITHSGRLGLCFLFVNVVN
jgi:hypothetical protein